MPRKSVLTPRMEAEIAVAEIARAYNEARANLDEWRRSKVRAAETVAAAERSLAEMCKLHDAAYTLERQLAKKLSEAEVEYGKLEAEFQAGVDAKLLPEVE